MKVGLFIPCYIDQFYPKVGIATLKILTDLGLDVYYPDNQTCCGQPLANSGFESNTKECTQRFAHSFSKVDYIVGPSASCVLHVKEHTLTDQTDEMVKVRDNIFELCEFLVDVVKVSEIKASFPYKTGIHRGCHGQRGLKLGSSTELNVQPFDKIKSLLEKVNEIELCELSRSDECCGFGGTFATNEEAISVRMGEDRITDHQTNGVEVITSADMSCLMHLEGIIKRQKRDLRVMHIAEILSHSLS